ncbi:polysaccharide biosynthesis tyrosine autokinase [Acidithiobacillus thiooxidans]|uniref:GumC family protein n=1 Tax=Acidithiobacillus thiooxidans TaxID=930 RepID=UPI001C07715D|nr:polysaccharide biosynthesis tyrosine autokinase [Acidithiobacillus thiooxidans]
MTDHTENMHPSENVDLQRRPSIANNSERMGDEGEKIDLSALLRSLKRHWRLPLGLAGVGAVLAILITLFSVPVFESSGSVYLGNAEKDQAAVSAATEGLSLVPGLVQAPNLETQVQIMQSRQVVERAIVRSGVNVSILNPDQSPVVHFWYWLVSGHSFNIYEHQKTGLRATLAEAVNPDIYGKSLDLKFTKDGHYQIFDDKNLILNGVLDEPAVSPNLRIIIKPDAQGFIPDNNSIYHLTVSSPLAVYKEFAGNISVSQDSKDNGGTPTLSYLIYLSFKNPNPYVSQRFLNSLMLSYLEQTHAWATGQASSTYDYLNGQLEKVRTALATADGKLARYQSHSGLLSVTSNAQAMITQMTNYESQRNALDLKLKNLQQVSSELSGKGGSHVDSYLVTSLNDSVLNSLSEKLVTAQNRKASLATMYTDRAPEMQQLDKEIASIRSAISSVIHNQEVQTQQQLKSLDGAIDQYKSKMGQYPREALQVLSLTRSTEVLGKLYMFLLEKQKEAAISRASTITKNRILDTALVHSVPVSPKASKAVLIGAFLGLLLGLAVVFARFLLHKGFHSDEGILSRYPSIPLFGKLPEYEAFQSVGDSAKIKPIVPSDPRSTYGEALRLLRGKLYLDSGAGNAGKVLMFSSAFQGDGKTTVVSQLAVALAKDGKRALLIDADLRHPQLHSAFDCKQSPGFAEYLAGNAKLEDCTRVMTRFDVPLTCLPSGQTPDSPVELIGKERFAELIDKARSEYDYVLIDTPPFPVLSDGLIIARLVDRLVSVIRVGETPRSAFKEHMQGVAEIGCPQALLINGAPTSQGGVYHYHPRSSVRLDLENRVRSFISQFQRKR